MTFPCHWRNPLSFHSTKDASSTPPPSRHLRLFQRTPPSKPPCAGTTQPPQSLQIPAAALFVWSCTWHSQETIWWLLRDAFLPWSQTFSPLTSCYGLETVQPATPKLSSTGSDTYRSNHRLPGRPVCTSRLILKASKSHLELFTDLLACGESEPDKDEPGRSVCLLAVDWPEYWLWCLCIYHNYLTDVRYL